MTDINLKDTMIVHINAPHSPETEALAETSRLAGYTVVAYDENNQPMKIPADVDPPNPIGFGARLPGDKR